MSLVWLIIGSVLVGLGLGHVDLGAIRGVAALVGVTCWGVAIALGTSDRNDKEIAS